MDKASELHIGEMSIMDASGHKQLTWNMERPEEIAAAQATFDRLIGEGYSAFGSKKKTEPKHATTTFDPAIEDMIMVPRTVGG